MPVSASNFLHALIRKEARSLLQYVSESFPWASLAQTESLSGVMHIAHHEANQLAQLIRYCVKQKHGNPPLGAYPQSFMGINFMSLDFLLPLLVDDHKKRIAELEWSMLSTPADAHGMIRDLVGAKKKHLAKMEAMLPPAAAPAA